jgi:hypothetical protein
MFCSNRVVLRRLRCAHLMMLVGTGATVAFFTLPALAYRPFDGTDAAVADKNELEIELQPFGWRRDDQQKTLVMPGARINYGFAERWEFLVEGQFETPLSPSGPSSFAADDTLLKYIVKPGSLQDKTGLSIATEFGPLWPEVNGDRGVGFTWAAIVSQRWDWGTAHFNVEANLTRDHQGEAFLDVILEGPAKWKVRPVFEVFYDRVWTQTETYSGLVGAIWQVRDNLSFDAGFRYALVNGHPVNEIRAGLTFGFDVGGEAKKDAGGGATKPGVTFGNWALRADQPCPNE